MIRWYFNGEVVRTLDTSVENNPDFPHHTIEDIGRDVRFSTALIDGDFDGVPQQNEDGSWQLDGQSMDVDWVRVYESTGPRLPRDFEDFDAAPDTNDIDDRGGTPSGHSVADFRTEDRLRVFGFESQNLDGGATDDGVSTVELTDVPGPPITFTLTHSSGDDPLAFLDDATGSPTPTGLSHRLRNFGLLPGSGGELTLNIESDRLLEGLGIVALSDETRGSYTISGLITLGDGSTVDLGSLVVGEKNSGSDDTFVGYIDETGLGIRSLKLTAGSASTDLFPSFDELAFVAVPEPASVALLGLGGAVMLNGRRRRC